MNIVGLGLLIGSFYRKKLPSLEGIEERGLLAVKIAQHYALRVDFLSEEMCTHLSKLYTHSYSKSIRDIEEVVEDIEVLDIMCSWESKPFAVASVGQVHRGTLMNGDKVVIKLIKKRYEKKFLSDIDSLEGSLKGISSIWKRFNNIFNPLGIIRNIRNYTLEELDLLNEARGNLALKALRNKEIAEFDLERLKFPKIYKEYSGKNIMVSSYVEGETFDELLRNGTLHYSDLIELFKIHGFYIFKLGVFHGDMHPGNVILGRDDKLYFIDCGSISIIPKRLSRGLFWHFYHLSRYNYSESARYLNKMSKVELVGSNYSSFLRDYLDLYSDFEGKNVGEISLTKRMMETIKLGIESGMDFGEDMFSVIKSLMYLDGMVLKCNPKAMLMEDMREFSRELKKYMID